MSLMEQFSNPNTVHDLGFGEKLAGAGITTLMGMGTTFVILMLLWGIIASTTKIMNVAGTRKAATAVAAASAAAPAPTAATPAAAPAPTAAAPAPEVEASNDEALTAVIAAAIAAYEGGTTEPDLIVKRIRRVSGPATVWANAGRNESIDSRKM